MTDSDKANFRDLVVGSANTLGQYIDPVALKFWWSDLKAYDYKDVEKAFETFRRDSTGKMPTIGQVIHLINERKKQPMKIEDGEKQPIPEGMIEKIMKDIEDSAKAMTCKPTKNLTGEE